MCNICNEIYVYSTSSHLISETLHLHCDRNWELRYFAFHVAWILDIHIYFVLNYYYNYPTMTYVSDRMSMEFKTGGGNTF